MTDRGRIKVLIADDAADIRMLLRLSLERDGRFEVVGEAADGAGAIRLTESTEPDAVVLDLSMPVMDGLEAAAEIRKLLPGARIVVLSGFTAERMSDKALASGADRYLEKGAAVHELASALLEVCGRTDGGPPPPPPAASPKASADEVMSLVGHELQTPLTALKGFAAVLKAGVDTMDRDQIVASADAIGRSADNLSALARSFADANAIEAGSLRLVRSQVDLSRLVEETVRDLSTVTGPHPVAVEARAGVRVPGDPVRLRQVITNLVSNAAKYSPADAPIEIRVGTSDTKATVEVVDHGTGIPVEREDELFRRFARFDESTPGTGLGLYISRGIALAHGGDLTHGRAASGGARFLLALPLGAASPPPLPEP